MVFGETPAEPRRVGRLRENTAKMRTSSLFLNCVKRAKEVEGRDGVGGTQVGIVGLGTPNHPPTLSCFPSGQGVSGWSIGFSGFQVVEGSWSNKGRDLLQVPVSPPITPKGPKRIGPGAAVVHSPPKALGDLRPTAVREREGRWERLMPDPSSSFVCSSQSTQRPLLSGQGEGGVSRLVTSSSSST